MIVNKIEQKEASKVRRTYSSDDWHSEAEQSIFKASSNHFDDQVLWSSGKGEVKTISNQLAKRKREETHPNLVLKRVHKDKECKLKSRKLRFGCSMQNVSIENEFLRKQTAVPSGWFYGIIKGQEVSIIPDTGAEVLLVGPRMTNVLKRKYGINTQGTKNNILGISGAVANTLGSIHNIPIVVCSKTILNTLFVCPDLDSSGYNVILSTPGLQEGAIDIISNQEGSQELCLHKNGNKTNSPVVVYLRHNCLRPKTSVQMTRVEGETPGSNLEELVCPKTPNWTKMSGICGIEQILMRTLTICGPKDKRYLVEGQRLPYPRNKDCTTLEENGSKAETKQQATSHG